MSVFLDTVGLLALWNRRDQWHDVAVAAFADLATARHNVVTTPYVLLECGNAAARYPIRQSVIDLRSELIRIGNVLMVTDAEIDLAWQSYATGDASQAGIVDHISFIVMRREGITQAFTNDHHFEAAGFETLC